MLDFAVTVVYVRVTDFQEFVFEDSTDRHDLRAVHCLRAIPGRRGAALIKATARLLSARRQDVRDRACRGERTDAAGRAFRPVDGATA
jgi:hypothetical protein